MSVSLSLVGLATTALPATVTIASVGRVVHAQGNCMLINDSITVTIAAAA